jgi:hypothetical protein
VKKSDSSFSILENLFYKRKEGRKGRREREEGRRRRREGRLEAKN